MAANAVDLTTVATVQAQLGVGSGVDASLLQVLITSLSRHIQTRCGRRILNGVATYTDLYDGSGSDKQYLRDWPILNLANLLVFGQTVLASPDGINPGWVIGDQYAASVALLPGTAIGGPISYAAWLLPLGRFPRGRQNVKAIYTAGYPISAWAATTAYALGTGYVDPNNNVQVVTTAGTSGSPSQPAWNALVGGTTTDGSVTWTNRGPSNYAGSPIYPNADPTFNGAPSELGQAVTEFIAQQYRRRDWVDQARKQIGPAGESIDFRSWEFPPWINRVIENYRRTWWT